MTFRTSSITLLLLPVLGVSPADAQLGGKWKALKDKAKQTIEQQIGGTPGTTPGTPADAPGKPTVPPGSTQAQVEIDKSELLPNLAVDEAMVAKQQAALKEDCEKQRPGGLSCDCIVASYPQVRLMTLSREIRRIKRQQDSACSYDKTGPLCQTYAAQFADVTGADFQRKYPTRAPIMTRDHGREITDTGILFPPNIYLEFAKTCVDLKGEGEKIEQECLNAVESGSIRLPPGKSTKGYCACTREEFVRLFEKGKLEPTSKDIVGATTEARFACMSK